MLINLLKKKRIVLLGAGGNCLDIFEALNEIGEYEICGYINHVEDPFLKNQLDLNYIGTEKDLDLTTLEGLIITFAGIGKNINARKLAYEKYKNYSPSLLFKDSSISKSCKISDKGVIIFGQTVIKSFTNIQDNVFVNSGTIIGHHVEIKKNTVISLGVLIGGRATIGEEVFIGMGAKIFQGIKIGKGAIIAAGAIVRKDVPEYSKFYK